MILINLIRALLITQTVEFAMAWVIGYREKRTYLTLFLINIITNPSMNFIIQLLFSLNLTGYDVGLLLIFEVIVVIVEWKLLVYALEVESKSCFKLSALMNLASFAFGIFIFGI